MTKITAKLAMDLQLCYDQSTADAAISRGGKEEYTVDEILLGNFIPHDDALFVVCREEVTPVKVLRDFAILIAREHLGVVVEGISGAGPFTKAVEFLSEGNADERLGELAEHAETVQKCIVSSLVIEGTGDWTKPDKIAAYERLLSSAKVIRAALKPTAGEAAYAVANHAYKAAKGTAREEVGAKLRGQLAEIYKASK